MVGFPDFTLSKREMSIGVLNQTIVTVSANPVLSEFNDFVESSGVTYHWGLQTSDNSEISWSVSDQPSISLNKNSTRTHTDVYFYVENDSGTSDIYTTRVFHWINNSGNPPWIVLGDIVVNPYGQLMTTEDLQQETEVNVKSLENEVHVLKIKGEDIYLTFDSSMSGRILLEKLCENTGFRDMMMCMKPWGDQELLVKTIIIEDCNGKVLYERPLSVMYIESL